MKKNEYTHNEMINLIYGLESTIESIRMKLDNPDLISKIEMK